MAYVTTFDIERDRKDIDVTKRIKEERPNLSTFMVLLMRARKETTTNTILHWWDDRPWAWWTKVNQVLDGEQGSKDSSGLANYLEVEDATIFRPNDTALLPETGEQILVTKVTITNAGTGEGVLTVQRAYSDGGTPIKVEDDAKLLWLANAMAQFSRAPESKIAQPQKRFNNTQTVRSPFDESMQSATDNLITSEKERQRLRRKKMFDHRLSLERTAIWGQRHEDSGGKRHLTAGINQFVTTDFRFSNYLGNGRSFDSVFFREFADASFEYGNEEDKLLLASPSMLVLLNEFARDKIETSTGDTTYGLKLKYLQTAIGKLFLVPSRTFGQHFVNRGFVLDMENIKYRPKQTRDTKLRINIQDNDEDGWRDEYLTEFAMQVELDKTHLRVDFSFGS